MYHFTRVPNVIIQFISEKGNKDALMSEEIKFRSQILKRVRHESVLHGENESINVSDVSVITGAKAFNTVILHYVVTADLLMSVCFRQRQTYVVLLEQRDVNVLHPLTQSDIRVYHTDHLANQIPVDVMPGPFQSNWPRYLYQDHLMSVTQLQIVEVRFCHSIIVQDTDC